MSFIEGRTRFGDGPAIYVAMLAAVLTLTVVSLLAFPAKALAATELSIDKQGKERVEPGAQFDYVLTVSNAEGADPATGVTVTDQLPSGVTLVGSEPDICGSVDGSTVTCDPFDLEAGEDKEIILTVEVASGKVGEITNRAKVEADGVPPVDSNEVTTTVAPDLVIDKLDDPDPVKTEALLVYTLRVQNQSDVTAFGVAVTDELPLDVVDFVDVDSNDFAECKYTAGVIQCTGGTLGPGEIGKVLIVVEPEKAGTIQNTGAVIVDGVREPLDTDTESTVVKGGDGGGGDGGGGDGPGGTPGGTPGGGDDVPQGEQCSPVVERGTDKTVGVISGTTPQGGTFTNTFSETLPLRIAYATSSENGSLSITVTPKDGGKAVLDKTIKGKKSGFVEVATEAGTSYDVMILPEGQGYAVKLQIGSGTDPCTDPSDLDPPSVPGGDDNGVDDNGTGDNGTDDANDVIDETISDKPLPPTGGPSLLGLAVIAFGLSVGGACVAGAGVRRRGR